MQIQRETEERKIEKKIKKRNKNELASRCYPDRSRSTMQSGNWYVTGLTVRSINLVGVLEAKDTGTCTFCLLIGTM